MLIPSKNRKAIYEYLFNEGVAVAKKDFNLKQHPNIPGVTNLEVIKALKSLASRELVKEQFAWRHYYWYLTDEGIAHLRESKPGEVRVTAVERIPRSTLGKDADREAYRIADKVTEAGPGAAMPYRAGFGRGAPPPQ
ncbi:hypothetical protein KIN20_016905 [Parelaphostrongylus tenuis]|uniref:Plectin/eS10 N-terminal domain-containing protein n=1 Tax=Parelaphostrongylus tenuis TaxID=148309 RepID=A0AAD5MHY7_PARTN|nr:hypothetical protein KIN20_016905 [Parelaphostrongylus tenuis]